MADKKKKKLWYTVFASKHFDNVVIGESSAYEDKNLIGRIININLGSLVRDMKLQNVRMKFEVNKVENGKAYTGIKGYELSGSYIKRMVRVGRSRIDDSFLINTKDNVKVRLKPLVLTKYKAQRGVLTGMRKLVREIFVEYINKETYDKFVSELINKKLQKDLRFKLNKIYPVSMVEIRVMQRV